MHWYMPVSPTARLEILSTEVPRDGLLIEITPPALSSMLLWYQVTVGAGIPDTLQVKVCDCVTSFSKLSGGDNVAPGAAARVWREWKMMLEVMVITPVRSSVPTLDRDSGST